MENRWTADTFGRRILLARKKPGRPRRRASPAIVAALLSLAVAVPAGVAATPAAATTGHGLGKPALPKTRVDHVDKVTGLGAAAERENVARAEADNAAQVKKGRAERKATWPGAGEATGTLPATGTLRKKVGGLPVTVARGSADPASGSVQLHVLDQHQAQAAGVDGVLLSVSADTAGSARINVGYSKFASAYGGGWSGRLRLVELPACALTSPAKPECRTQTPLKSSNNLRQQTLTGDVDLKTTPTAEGNAAAVTVLALAAGFGESASGSGNYAASPLPPSSTWAAGGSSGSFTWSYPMATPPAAAGPAPDLSLSYDSGSIDGRTSSTNNQGSQVGEGFDLSAASYVERSYGSCDDDGQADKYDLCWKYDNASLILNGKSTELVKDDTTGKWRLKDDDASTVTHSTGAANGDDGDPITGSGSTATGDGAGEYWTITTGDGTQYIFGLNKLPGADTERTNSVWTVPVFGDDSGEPGYSSGTSFSGRSKVQAWRWNLDEVVDPHDNAMSYWYTPETNYYAENGATTGTAQYTRGGYLDHILYGQRSNTVTTDASEKVQFSYTERCTASDCSSLTKDTANDWPDVPFDTICASKATCHATGPAFFTRKRLTKVETLAWNAAAATPAYAPVDAWAFAQEYRDPGDIGNSTDQTMVLDSIKHTGENGGTVALDPVTFTYQMLANRVDGFADDALPLQRPRIYTITSETDAITTVTLSDPECVSGSSMPAAEDNDTSSCYPVYWHVNGAAEATLDWFHKYRVLAVVTSDPTGHGETMESSYDYSGPAWHYNDDPFTPEPERTWSVWRGYHSVTATTGSTGTQSKMTTVYMQGMDGDKQKNGTTRSLSAVGIGFAGLSVPAILDSDQYAGFGREQITYDGATPISATVSDPFSSKTASQQKSYANINAYYVRTAKTQTSTYLTATSSWRTRSTDTTYDSYGMPTAVNDAGQVGVSGDETCTRTWYARNPDKGITSLVSRTRTTGQICSTAETALSLPDSINAKRGDLLSDTATVYDNTAATAWTADQTPTLGEATWTGRASGYPATATAGERNPAWQTLTKTTYDNATVKLGRPLSVTDNAGNTTSTAYIPAGVGPLTRIQVTNPKVQNSFTWLDFARGSTVKSQDVAGKVTETAYDALGRTTGVWLPNQSRVNGAGANYTYAYHLSSSAPSWTSTSSIIAPGAYNTDYTIYDALLRPLQTQSPTPNGGRLLTDTRYDTRGLAYETFADVFDSQTTPSGTYVRAEYGGAPKQSDTVFDGAGRPTTSTFRIYGVQKTSTTTSYTGDSTATTAPAGGSATRTITDVFGRTTEQREYAGANPADSAYGAGVGTPYTSTRSTYTRDGKPNTITGPDSATWSYVYDPYGRQIAATDPDKGTTTTGYTSLDQVDTTTDADSNKLLYSYDVLGRKTDLYQTDRTDAHKLGHWAYDTLLKGQLDSSTSYVSGATTSGTAYTQKVTAYDIMSRPTTTELDLPATDPLVTSGAVPAKLVTSTDYNPDGTQQYIDTPAAGGLPMEHIKTDRNTLGLPTAVQSASGQYLLTATYNRLSQPQQYTLGTSTTGVLDAFITNTYEEGTDRLTRSDVTDQTHPDELQDLNYGYDDAGNVTHTFDTTTGGTGKTDNQCFTYDGHQRLTEAWTPTTPDCATTGRTTVNLGGASPYWTSYTYNDAGLRQTQTDHTTAGSTLSTSCYNPTRPHALTTVLSAAATCTGATAKYAYDADGNTTTRPNGTDTQTLTWTPQGQLNTIASSTAKSTTNHIYDANGNLLIRRTTTGESVLYLGDTEVHLTTSTATPKYWAQRYYSAGDTTIALRSNQSGTSKLTWLAGDQHGTSSLALDATTQAVTKRYTTVFGAPRTGTTGTWPDDKTFLGDPTDTATGLTYIGAREYDAAIGRFISVDTLLDTSDPQSLNGYTYADNNPVTMSDPTGLRPLGPGDTDYENHQWALSQHWNYYGWETDSNGGFTWYQGNSGSGAGGSSIRLDYKVPSAGARKSGHSEGWVTSNYEKSKRDAWGDAHPTTEAVLDLITEQVVLNVLLPGSGPEALAAKGLTDAEEALREGEAEAKGSKPPKECNSFDPKTSVLMEDGSTKPIAKVQTGEKVESADPETGRKVGGQTVTATHVNHDNNLIDVVVETAPGQQATLHTTTEHPFWDDTTHNWVNADELTPGHSLETSQNTHATVTAVHITPGAAVRYNLTVDQLHTYYVLAGTTPILVHNVGGSCPVTKGKAGEDRAAQELTDRGYTIMGTHVLLEAKDGTTSYVDFVATRNGPSLGAPEFFEVKNGPGSSFSPQQRTVYGQMGNEGNVILRSDKLESWGLRSGDLIPQSDVSVILYGGATGK